MDKKYKLLIVDDSIVLRTFLRDLFSGLPDFEIIGTASDPYKARDIMKRNWPDVITLDVEMPRMNGIDFLKKIMRSRPTPVVMISTLTRARAPITLQALEIGAFDYFPKPEGNTWEAFKYTKEDIVEKVRSAVRSNIKKRSLVKEKTSVIETTVSDRSMALNKVILIGSSTGGVQALTRIFVRLPASTPGIAVVQHMPPTFVESLAEQLDKKSQMTVKVGEDNEPLTPGKAVIAPGNCHLEIQKRSGMFYTRLSKGKPVGYHMPAVNVLFHSASKIGGPDVLGIILTGMGEDGAGGILEMRNKACRTIGQDKETSIVYGMPRKAWELGAIESQVSLQRIPLKIVEFGEGRL
jgi:two-component system chemotaxis response regulator CheB